MQCPLIVDSLATLLIFTVGSGLGLRLLRLLRIRLLDPLEKGVFAVGLGMGCLAYLPFLCFSLGIGRAPIISGLLLVTAAVLWRDEFDVLKGAMRGLRTALAGARRNPVTLLVILILPLLLVTYLRALCPPSDADGMAYHLTAPMQYLAAGRFFYMPTFLHVNWPLGVEMLFGLGLSLHRYYPAGMIQFGLGIALVLGIYAFGRRLGSPLAGALAAGLTFWFVRGEMSWAYIDVGLTLYTLLAVYTFAMGWSGQQDSEETPRGKPDPDETRRWQLLAALFAGLAATSKLTGALIVVLIAAMTLWATWERSRSAGDALRAASVCLAAGLLIVMPWYLRSFVLTGSPVYPYFSHLVKIPDWDDAAQKRMTYYFQAFNTMRARNLTAVQVYRIRALTSLVLAAFGFALMRRRGVHAYRPLVFFFFGLAFLLVATSGIYLRFMLPIVPVGLLLLFLLFQNALVRSWPLAWILTILLALRLYGASPTPHLPQALISGVRSEAAGAAEGLRIALGRKSRDAYLAESLQVYPLERRMNRELPADSRIVMGIWSEVVAPVERRTLVTYWWIQNALRLDSDEHLVEDLRRLRATHLVMSDTPDPTAADFGRMGEEDRMRALNEFPKLRRVSREYGTPLFSENGFTVYALNLKR